MAGENLLTCCCDVDLLCPCFGAQGCATSVVLRATSVTATGESASMNQFTCSSGLIQAALPGDECVYSGGNLGAAVTTNTGDCDVIVGSANPGALTRVVCSVGGVPDFGITDDVWLAALRVQWQFGAYVVQFLWTLPIGPGDECVPTGVVYGFLGFRVLSVPIGGQIISASAGTAAVL